MSTVGIIGGSGLYGIEGLSIQKEIAVSTPYGEPSSTFREGILEGAGVVFLARHGVSHLIPPHKVNYRANIWGFKSLGVDCIISVSAVGGISDAMPPGAIVLPDQIIDATYGARTATFFDDRAVHVDFTEPFCPDIRTVAVRAATEAGIPLIPVGTYICVNGPRLETAAEIRCFSAMGADVVGMTAMPEAVLAREAEICLAGICVVANKAAGLSSGKLTAVEVVETMRSSADRIIALLKAIVPRLSGSRYCACREALKNAEM